MGKEKLKHPFQIRWMHRRWFAVLVGIIFFGAGLAYIFEPRGLPLSVSPLTGRFELLLGIPISMTGLAVWDRIRPNFSISRGMVYPVLDSTQTACAVIVLAGASLGLILIIIGLQRWRKPFAYFVKGYIVAHLGLYALIIALSGVTAGQGLKLTAYFDRRCEYTLSETIRIRADYYDNSATTSPYADGFDTGYYSFTFDKSVYFVSRDGGQTWQEFMQIESFFEDCEQETYTGAGLLDGEVFWLWISDTLVMTHDSGRTWHYTKLRDFVPSGNGAPFQYPLASDIMFTTAKSGQLNLRYYDRAAESYQVTPYATIDGGMTWHPAQ